MRVLVCGGRDWCDILAMMTVMDEVHSQTPVSALIHGGARGADDEAATWAMWRDVPISAYPADWQQHGRAAGPLRNARMLAEGKPDLVIAFPGGRGTADMVAKARAAGVPVRKIATRPTSKEPRDANQA